MNDIQNPAIDGMKWTRCMTRGLTPGGWEVALVNRPGKTNNWFVFDADGQLVGMYETREEALGATR